MIIDLNTRLFVNIGFSYNRPILSSTSQWNPNGTTIANESIIGSNPFDFFINQNNTIYISNKNKEQILVFLSGNVSLIKAISVNITNSSSLFVTTKEDIFVDTFHSSTNVVSEIKSNSTKLIPIPRMNFCQQCFHLFLSESYQTLYCSLSEQHQVISRSLINPWSHSSIVAGTASPGSTSATFRNHRGIFFDEKSRELLVADCGNHRIQLFEYQNLLGTTVVGNGSPNVTFDLDCPTGIALNSEKGSGANQLRYPSALSFDSVGNILVVDQGNSRIQKFNLIINSGFSTICSNSSTTIATTTVAPGAATTLWYMNNPCSPQTTYMHVTLSYVAQSAKETITFAVVNVPAYTWLDDISVVDATTSAQLLCNGDFENGTCSPCWIGSGCTGHISTNTPHNGTYGIYNGATSMTYMQQTFNTTIGRHLRIGFWTKWSGSISTGITTSVSIQP
ncbi:unnamed protein product [Adineta ricciae]|uniref:NHL repeat containing protein n=1 Tax=Adineta ricciae TaxID=249248 RepID=A0A814MWP6_ADIRI|nr:unnamed protein product [Adineta ricciae]